jgi:N-acetylglucosaminyldiphosphoundecaprenol N-acetyl-beta-D-mannosaminyltransferase
MTSTSTPRSPDSLRLGSLRIDDLTFEGALDAIEALVRAGRGGTVFTPNVDHVVLVDEDPRLRAAYEDVSLSLVDRTPVLWAARLLGHPLPEKISGSDLVLPLLKRAAERGFRVYFLGGGEGVAEKAAKVATELHPTLKIVGTDAPFINIDRDDPRHAEIAARIVAAKPDLVLVALGCPKQEVFMHRVAEAIAPAVSLGIGAGLDFIAGTIPRAPAWISAAGLEWLFRLAREPRRLWRRYLIRDPKFLLILLRDLRNRRHQS